MVLVVQWSWGDEASFWRKVHHQALQLPCQKPVDLSDLVFSQSLKVVEIPCKL